MKYFSLFSGIGGFEKGIQKALQGKADCVGFSEINHHAITIYQKHFPTHANYGDITKIKARALPDFDLLVSGFPCQSFSIAGRRKGFKDPRGQMFFHIARILRAKKPSRFILENVKGLVNHDSGRTFQTIIATLMQLGYRVEWQVLNSKDFAVPQNRERVFILGTRRANAGPEIFPFPATDKKDTRVVGQDVAYAIDANYAKGTNTLAKCRRSLVEQNNQIRRLTPMECERLQGFPDGWTAGISDAQRYKCLGNAVTVPVITALAKMLLR